MPTDEQIAADPYLADRYGAPSRLGQRAGLIAIAAVIAATVAGFVYTGYHAANPSVAAAVTRFQVIDNHHARVSIEVHKPASAGASCVVRVFDLHAAEVARKTATIDAAAGRVVTRTYQLTTSGRAHAAQVSGCARVTRAR